MIQTIQKYSIAALIFILIACEKQSDVDIDGVPLPGISISDYSAAEGNSGLTDFNFEVTLNRSYPQPITIQYNIIEGSAKANEDYEPVTNGSITIAGGKTTGFITVKVVGDEFRENIETFSVELVSANLGVITRKTAVGTILNDDTKLEISQTGYTTPLNYDGYTMVWSDEFTDGFDNNIWSNQNGDGCPDLCGWGNNELEYYTDRPENIYTQEGKLIIEAKKENFQGREYTSSKLISKDKKTLKYGRIDIRAQLPKGQGIWPAFWMMPQHDVYGGWPSSGEIDIMEMVGNTPHQTHGTVHYGPGPSSIYSTSTHTLSTGVFNDEFHVFSLIWEEDLIIWLVDDVEFKRITPADIGSNHWPFNEEFYMIINFAVGGNWPGNPNATTEFPSWLIVDYVRYFAPNE